MARSTRAAGTRDPRLAVSNWRTTASGVTSRAPPVCMSAEYRGVILAYRPGRAPERHPGRRAGTNMDIDRFLATNGATWDRLARLTAEARRGVGGLDPARLDE